jgi:hypothetical protein
MYPMARGIFAIAVLMIISGQQVSLANDPLPWHADYGNAMQAAKDANRMMLVYFRADHLQDSNDPLAERFANDPQLRKLLERYELVRLPYSAKARIGGEEVQLVEHASFAELGREPGLVIIDFSDPESEFYGCVVSVYPFSIPDALSSQHLAKLLDLPSGSLTQRSLILAVRMHPEQPASTEGQLLDTLADESKQHSERQARMNLQGHHQWESRFHRINRLLPGGLLSQEVCAESWPGQGLMHAAIECVQSWRQSSGHWQAVRSRHSFFGYDMKRGRNGVWYATGIFSIGR